MQQAELQSSLIQRINEAHALCMSAAGDLRDVVLRAVNNARECGIFLSELRDSTPHGSWQEMFSDRGLESNTRFTFTYQTAQRYIRYSEANPLPITELADGIRSAKDAMIASGAIPSPTHGVQLLHDGEQNFFIAAGKQLMAFSSLWEKQMTLHPVGEWNRETAEQFVVQMAPIIEKLNNVYATAKARAYEKAA